MSSIGYKPCLSDPDIWLKPEVWDAVVEYNLYILCYVDEIMVVNHDIRPDLDRIDQLMKLKEGSVGYPDIYLVAKLKKVRISNDVWC